MTVPPVAIARSSMTEAARRLNVFRNQTENIQAKSLAIGQQVALASGPKPRATITRDRLFATNCSRM